MTTPDRCVSVEGAVMKFNSPQRYWEAMKWLKSNFSADIRTFKLKFPDAIELHVYSRTSSDNAPH